MSAIATAGTRAAQEPKTPRKKVTPGRAGAWAVLIFFVFIIIVKRQFGIGFCFDDRRIFFFFFDTLALFFSSIFGFLCGDFIFFGFRV